MAKLRAAITGVHGWLPEDRLTNADLERLVDTTDEWILTRTGIRERRILKEPGVGTSFMGANAARGLLEQTGTDPADIDLVICATVTPDHQFPATANIIANSIGAVNSFSYDINAACSGFLYALVTGAKFIESETYKKVLIVGADKMSSIIDYSDRTTCVIFGDGAGAVLLEPSSSGNGILDHVLKSDGSGKPFLFQKAGGSAWPASAETVANKEHYVHQEGKTVFKFAVQNMADVAEEIMKRNALTSDDIDWLVPHQANLRIISATSERMGLSDDKVMINIQKYGNTTAGTLPLCLYDWQDRLNPGDNIVLASFGGGFTWGAVYLKWGA